MKSISDEILQEGVDFEVTISKFNLLHHLKIIPKKKKFRIYPLCLGSMLRIAKIINNIDNLNFKQKKNESWLEAGIKGIIRNTDLIAEVIALAIWNSKYSDYKVIRYFQKLRVKRISEYIRKNLDAQETLKIVNLVLEQMEIEHFLACMVSIKGMTIVPKDETGKKEISGS